MLERFLRFLWPVRLYALIVGLALGWFAWGTATRSRLLGDDNESTETLNAPSTRTGHTGHGLYFHK